MEIKNLLNKLHHSQASTPPTSLFLALYLTNDVVQVGVWQVVHNQIELLSQGSLVSWDGLQAKSLAQAVDKSLTTALTTIDMSAYSESNEIVFGLPTSWLDESKDLKPDKKKLLKELSHQLDLKPLGFTLFLESLLVYLQHKEGTPLNALLFHLNDLEITLSLIRQGKFVQTETLDRGDDFVNDCETLLKRLDQTQPLPSRIILFDGHHDLQELVQLLNSQDLSQEFNFLHLPQVEALPQDVGIHAVALVGGEEIAKSLNLITPSTSQDPLALSTPAPNHPNLEDLGFSLDQDQQPPSPSEPTPPSQPPKPKFKLPSLPTFSLPKLSLPSFSFSKLPLIVGLLVLLTLVGGLAAFFWFVPQANLTLYLKPKTIQTKLNLKLDPNLTQPDLNHQALPSQTFHQQLQAQKTITTTGTGLVGDKATGTVTIYNRTSLPKTFNSGTVLTANKLKFTLTDSVTVASKSTAADYTETPGKAEVKVVAADIGDQYNLPADTEFQVANYSLNSFVARNQAPFTGGSSHQVKLVSKSDQQQLYQALIDELKSQFQAQAATQSSDLVYLNQGFKVLKEDYSHQVGEEADQLSLDLQLDFYGLAYHKSDVSQLANQQLKDRLPLGFHPVDNSLQLESLSNHEATDSVQLLVKVALLPDLDSAKLTHLIKGKSLTQVSSLLHSLIPEFSKATLDLQPHWLPPKLRFLPFNPQHLHLSVQPLVKVSAN